MAKLFNRQSRPKEPRAGPPLLRSIEVWSVKVGLFQSLPTGIVVGAWLLWSVLANSGYFLNWQPVVLGFGRTEPFNLNLSFDNVMSTAVTFALLNIVLSTALAAIWATIF